MNGSLRIYILAKLDQKKTKIKPQRTYYNNDVLIICATMLPEAPGSLASATGVFRKREALEAARITS